VERFLAEHANDGVAYELAFCGRRGHMHFVTRATVLRRFDLQSATPRAIDASKISHDLEELFLNGSYDKVLLACNQFISPLAQVPKLQQLLPLETPDLPNEVLERAAPSEDILAEPDMHELLRFLVPRLVTFKVFYSLLENAAGEHGARMTAMDNATTNAAKLIKSTTLKRNRARQAAITTELIEIISGAEAL
jgi:F-type H+-transporting ATPase subunit gamma